MTTMSTNHNLLLSLTLAFGCAVPFVASAQQPAPPPQQADSGWRKFEGGPVAQREAPPREAPPMDGEQQPAQPPPQQQAQWQRPVPSRLVAPAGTWITIRVNDLISTDRNMPGDAFSATLAQPLIADGIVVARRGQMLGGRVAEVVKGGRVKGTARLGLELTEMSLADGRQVPVRTQLISYSAGTSRGRDASAIGVTTGTGAAIGAMAGGGVGAGIGALAGAAASSIGVLVTRGHASEVYPEATLTFRLLEPLTVATDRGAMAFHAAGQQDYETRLEQRGPVQMVHRVAPAYLGLGYGYGFPYYYSPFMYGPSFGYYRGGYYGGGYGGHGGGHGGRR